MIIPADVPHHAQEQFKKNYNAITKGADTLLLFAGDQKIEHLNPINPDSLFKIAAQISKGAFATHFGLIKRYTQQYPTINYIAKLNGKTNLIPTQQQDPVSRQLWSVDDVMQLKNEAHANICGVGYTIYLGSEHETVMLKEAAQLIQQAHQQGLVTILWIYPRGKAVDNEIDADLLAGAAGVANTLGSDFVKLKTPQPTKKHSRAQLIQAIVASAGNTKVLCAGGERKEPAIFLQELHEQLTIGGAAGSAVGRNIYQHDFEHACAMAQAIAALIYENISLEKALKIIKN